MIDKNGYEFEFAEKESGFVEEATAVFDNSAELLISSSAYSVISNFIGVHHFQRALQ